MTYVTLHWAFRRMLRHRIRNKGEGGAWRYGGGGIGMEAPSGKAPAPPPPEPIGAGDLTQAKSFSGPGGGALDAELPLGAGVLPLGGKGVGEAAALQAQVALHPLVRSHFGGGV